MDKSIHTASLVTIIRQIPLLNDTPNQEIRIRPLGGLTNQNYEVVTPALHAVLRIPQHSTHAFINRHHEKHNTQLVEQLKLAPATLWWDEAQGLRLTQYIEQARPLSAQILSEPRYLDALTHAMQQLQQSKQQFIGKLDQKAIIQRLKRYFEYCKPQQQKQLKIAYQEALALLDYETLFDRPLVPAHIDLVKENILVTKNKIWLIDWEYSAMSSPLWDVAILSNSLRLRRPQSEQLLQALVTPCNKRDFENLARFRIITATMSFCWEVAVSNK